MEKNITTIFKQPPQYVVDQEGKRVSVILDIETFRRIQEELEDFYDNLLMDEVEDEPRIPLEDALREEEELRDL